MLTHLFEELRVHSWYFEKYLQKRGADVYVKKEWRYLYKFKFPRGMNNDHSEEMRFSEKVMTDFLT